MRFMILLKGAPPGAADLAEMARFTADLVKAGVLLAAETLHPSAPAGADDLAGFWLIQVRSGDEAVAWARRCPRPDLELRQVREREDVAPRKVL